MPLNGGRSAACLGSLIVACAFAVPAQADDDIHPLKPDDILISRSVYETADIQPGATQLPPGCTAGNCGTANSDGAYPYVFNNDSVDGSFGVTSPLFLDELTPSGSLIETIPVPTDQLVTSFSSKSEGALNLSTDGHEVTFIDYVAPVDAIDVSNANTPGVIDPTNPVPGAYYRAAVELDKDGHFHFTETNAYSGNNGRAAVLNSAAHVFYTAGNAGNGSNPQPTGVILGAGAQIFSPSNLSESAQSPPNPPTPIGSFNINELGYKPDKIGKDDNFRGLTVYNNVVYYTKGSGGNGIDTVYFLDTTGKACPDGVGLPQPGAKLPTAPLAYDASTLQANGLPGNMCVLKGFNTGLAKASTNSSFPFGLWFANPTTLYVADEGDGTNSYDPTTQTYTDAASQSTAGLQKWALNSTTQSWQPAYVLQNGLNLGKPYTVAGYPVGNNSATKLPWAPATDGLRNIAGRVNRNGTATIWAVTSTVSGGGDQGADPNQIVEVTDNVAATTPGSESFGPFDPPQYDEVYREVTLTPESRVDGRH